MVSKCLLIFKSFGVLKSLFPEMGSHCCERGHDGAAVGVLCEALD